MRRLVALLLAHLTATVVATLALALRRFIAYDVPLSQSLTPVRFLPHLLLGPVYATRALVRFIQDDNLLDKRACESAGYIAPLLICYLIYTRLLVGRRRAGLGGFTPVVRDRFPKKVGQTDENPPKFAIEPARRRALESAQIARSLRPVAGARDGARV